MAAAVAVGSVRVRWVPVGQRVRLDRTLAEGRNEINSRSGGNRVRVGQGCGQLVLLGRVGRGVGQAEMLVDGAHRRRWSQPVEARRLRSYVMCSVPAKRLHASAGAAVARVCGAGRTNRQATPAN